jgi:hypothetical protein
MADEALKEHEGGVRNAAVKDMEAVEGGADAAEDEGKDAGPVAMSGEVVRALEEVGVEVPKPHSVRIPAGLMDKVRKARQQA